MGNFASTEEAQARLVEILASLGETEADVVHTLRNKGIKGVISVSCRCPVAVYVGAHDGVSRVGVYTSCTADMVIGVLAKHVEVPTPPSVFAFIRSFDDMLYPDLILGASKVD